MKVFYNLDGTIISVTGDSIFKQSNGANVLQIKIPYAESSSLQVKFLVPDGLGGVVPAEALITEMVPDYEDGGYMWEVPNGIDDGYLSEAGKAYLSVRVLYENGAKVKTTRLVQFTIEESGDYEATPVPPEQADQILALLATAQADIVALDPQVKVNTVYDAVIDSVDISQEPIYRTTTLLVTVPDLITVEILQQYGISIRLPDGLGGSDNAFNQYKVIIENESEDVLCDGTYAIYFQYNNTGVSQNLILPAILRDGDVIKLVDNTNLFPLIPFSHFTVTNMTFTTVAGVGNDGLMSAEDKIALNNSVQKDLPYDTATLTNTLEVYINNAGTGNKATLQELKTYILNGLASGMYFQGTWNADTNTPDLTAITTTGYFWIVNTAGSTDLGGITDWKVGDWAFKTNTGWEKVDNTDAVNSVNGKTGVVVLDAGDIAFDNTASGLTADTTQEAIDEIVGLIGDVETLLGGI